MLEALASSGSKAQVDFPNSGPGSKRLQYGTDKLGYFGSVAPAQFFSPNELRKQLNFQIGTDNNNDALNWVKAFYQGKVLFFPQFPFATGITWNQLYAAGLVYGVDGPGAFPAASGQVNQQRFVNIGSDVFKVRLFNPFVAGTIDGNWNRLSTSPIAGNSPFLSESEWSMLCQSLIQGVSSAYTGPKWGIYPSSSFLASGRTAFSMNTCTDNTYAVIVSNTQITGGLKTAISWWYPVLEFVPGNERPLLPMTSIENNVNGLPGPMTVDEIIQDVGLVKYRSRSAQVIFTPPNPVVDDITYESINKVLRTDVRVTTTDQSQPVIDDITYS